MRAQQVHPSLDSDGGAEGIYDAELQMPAAARDVERVVGVAGKYRGSLCVQMNERQRIMKAKSWWFVFAASTSLAAMLIGVLVAELEHFEDRYDADRHSLLSPFVLTLKFCITVATAVTIAALVFCYRGSIQLAKLTGLYVPESSDFFTQLGRAGLLEQFMLDVLAHLIFPWPFVHFDFQVWDSVIHEYSTYCIVDILVIGMFLRFILLPRLFCQFHELNSEEARVYGRFISLDVAEGTITKVLLNESFTFLLGVWVICICTFSYTLYMFERDYAFQNGHEHGGLGSFRNCVWLSVVTMTTIGYGDEYPVTRMGRISSVASCFVAVILFALTVNWVLSRLSLTYNEENLLKILRRVEARRKLKYSAVQVIERVYMRSPLYRRLRYLRAFDSYQKIAMFEQPSPGIAPDAKQLRPLGRFSEDEMHNLRSVLDDTRVMNSVRNLQQSRKDFHYFNGVHFADEAHQVSELTESQKRLEKQVRMLRGQVQQLMKAIKDIPPRGAAPPVNQATEERVARRPVALA